MKKKPSVVMTKKDKNPSGGLTAAGRAKYNAATGGNLQAPVSAKVPLKAQRKLLDAHLFVLVCLELKDL